MTRRAALRHTVTAPVLLASCLLHAPIAALADERPPLALAIDYADADIDVTGYWVSEKYDGVRAYWNGHRLLTRGGHELQAPAWFTAGWQQVPLDGELWAGRGQFETVVRTVRDAVPDDEAWRRIRFMVFDLPAHDGPFRARMAALNALQSNMPAWVQPVAQSRLAAEAELDSLLRAVVAGGGEGLMLHRDDAPYRPERSDALLKLKPYQDAEAQVTGYTPGQGKYQGMLGSLEVKTASGLTFRIGSGFTDEQRRQPPALGSWVTYSHHGLTARGVPRFARFLRARPELDK